MSIVLEETDHIVAFWHAEGYNGDDLLMMLRKRTLHWRLDWRTRHRIDNEIFTSKDTKIFRHAISGLQVTADHVFHDAQTTFEVTQKEFPLKRLCQRVDGNLTKFYEITKRYSFFHVKEVKKQ